jgi:hypothetical protein
MDSARQGYRITAARHVGRRREAAWSVYSNYNRRLLVNNFAAAVTFSDAMIDFDQRRPATLPTDFARE